jgi:hypothetical protein
MAAHSQVLLNIYNADNELAVFVNGRKVYSRKTEFDPPLNERIDLVPFLRSGTNLLTLIGINWGGPSAFDCALTLGNQTHRHAEAHPNPGNGVVWERMITFPY